MQINNRLASKLCRLLSFLDHAYKEFDSVSKQVKEKRIRMSVRSVATRTKQYMKELNSQLHMLNVKTTLVSTNRSEETKSKHVLKKNLSDKNIVEHCCDSEEFFSKAYNSILNEHLPFKPLRDMLRYQLSGIHNGFRQLKLLNSVMTPQKTDVMTH